MQKLSSLIGVLMTSYRQNCHPKTDESDQTFVLDAQDIVAKAFDLGVDAAAENRNRFEDEVKRLERGAAESMKLINIRDEQIAKLGQEARIAKSRIAHLEDELSAKLEELEDLKKSLTEEEKRTLALERVVRAINLMTQVV